MRLRKKRDDDPQPTPEHIADAKDAFQAALPGVGICKNCWQPTSSKAHRKRCGS